MTCVYGKRSLLHMAVLNFSGNTVKTVALGFCDSMSMGFNAGRRDICDIII